MAQQNPQIVFVSSILTSKIFWTQVVAAAAMIATAAGLHPPWLDASNQAELVGALATLATVALRLWGYSGPVALTAPLSTQAAQELPPGTHTVTVQPPPAPAAPPPPTVTVQPSAPSYIAPLSTDSITGAPVVYSPTPGTIAQPVITPPV